MLPNEEELALVRSWLKFLVDPKYCPDFHRSQSGPRLRKIRGEIKRLRKLQQAMPDDCAYESEALISLQGHEEWLLKEKDLKTYEVARPNIVVRRRLSVDVGNAEQTERLFVATLIARKLAPQRPYVFLSQQFQEVVADDSRVHKDFDPKALAMRVRRFEKTSGHDSLLSFIVEKQYAMFKSFVWSNQRAKLLSRQKHLRWAKHCRSHYVGFAANVVCPQCERIVRTKIPVPSSFKNRFFWSQDQECIRIDEREKRLLAWLCSSSALVSRKSD